MHDRSRIGDHGTGRAGRGETVQPPSIPDHELVRRIGQGAYGEVWLARNILGTHRAVKVVYRRAFSDARPYEREFAGIQRFEPISRSHEGLVDVLQIGRNDDPEFFYYVMELADDEGCSGPSTEPGQPGVEGEIDAGRYQPRTLASELRRRGRLPFGECLRIALDLAEALDHLHGHGLVHRDIKPSNIIFVGGSPRLADIGLVAEQGEASLVGTEGFIAPEGQGQPPADVFSLGKVLYEISTGKDRQRFPEPLTRLAELPDQADWLELNEIVSRACAPDLRARYQSAAELRTELVLLSGGKSVRRLRRLERSWRQAKYLGAVALLLVLGGFSTYIWFQYRAQTRYSDFLQRAQLAQSGVREAGWRNKAWQLVKSAAAVRAGPEAGERAVAVMAGMDATLVTHLPFEAYAIAFSPEGDRLLIGGAPNSGASMVRVADVEGTLWSTSTPTGVGPVAFSRYGRGRLYIEGAQGRWQVRDWKNNSDGRSLERLEENADWRDPDTVATAVSPDSSLLAVAQASREQGGRVVVWDCDSGRLLHTFPYLATCLAFSPDNTLLSAGNTSGQVRVWAMHAGTPAFSILESGEEGTASTIESLAFARKAIRPEPATPRQWLLAAGDSAGVVTIWDLATRHPGQFLRGAQSSVTALAFSADGTLLASGGRGAPVLWDVATGEQLLSLGYADMTTALAFSPDDRQLAVASRNGFSPGGVWLWALERDRGIRRLRGQFRSLTYVCADPAGKRLAALAQDWRVGIWDLASGQRVAELKVPEGVTTDNAALALSPDGREFAFSAGAMARRWDLGNGSSTPGLPLPRGLGDRLVYRPTGELLLIRQETLYGRPARLGRWLPPAAEDPRVFRVRNLLSPNPTNVIATIAGFNQNLKFAETTPDGSLLFLAGATSTSNGLVDKLAAIEPMTGRELWSKMMTRTNGWSSLAIDSTGRWLATELSNATAGSVLMEGPTGASRPGSFSEPVSAFHGPGTLWMAPMPSDFGHPIGWSVYAGSRTDPVVSFPSGRGGNIQPIIFRAGTMLAWGVDDGTVMVVDLPRVRSQLAALGLDWH